MCSGVWRWCSGVWRWCSEVWRCVVVCLRMRVCEGGGGVHACVNSMCVGLCVGLCVCMCVSVCGSVCGHVCNRASGILPPSFNSFVFLSCLSQTWPC